jgi:bifunctional NMN adenylyltransferase/nudix hydrolase
MQTLHSPSDYEFDLLVYVGRFQPFHFGHKAVIEEALTRARHVLILLGSANAARTARNPFTYEERQRMVADSIAAMSISNSHDAVAPASRVILKPLNDHLYNDEAWIREVQSLVYDTI